MFENFVVVIVFVGVVVLMTSPASPSQSPPPPLREGNRGLVMSVRQGSSRQRPHSRGGIGPKILLWRMMSSSHEGLRGGLQ